MAAITQGKIIEKTEIIVVIKALTVIYRIFIRIGHANIASRLFAEGYVFSAIGAYRL